MMIKKSRIFTYFKMLDYFEYLKYILKKKRYNPKYVFYNKYIMNQYKKQGLFKDKIILNMPYVPCYHSKLKNQKFDLRFEKFNYEMFEHVLHELGFVVLQEILLDSKKKDNKRRTIYVVKLA